MKARYFNSIVNNNGVVTKSSKDIYKINREFAYYYLLPDDLKKFFVKPYNYVESIDMASYNMDYSGITLYDFLSKGNLNKEVLDNISQQLNDYFGIRSKYDKQSNINIDFIYNKVISRMQSLIKLKEYEQIDNFLKLCNVNLYELLDEFKEKYFSLDVNNLQTISHGDLHFSNILISSDYTLRFIDVRGATNKEDLYIDKYYDFAKLLHSINGYYDYIINDNYDIRLNDNLDSYITIINSKNSIDSYNYIYHKIYDGFTKNELDLINVYTASLFLSMLPLHIDNIKRIVSYISIAKYFLGYKDSILLV